MNQHIEGANKPRSKRNPFSHQKWIAGTVSIILAFDLYSYLHWEFFEKTALRRDVAELRNEIAELKKVVSECTQRMISSSQAVILASEQLEQQQNDAKGTFTNLASELPEAETKMLAAVSRVELEVDKDRIDLVELAVALKEARTAFKSLAQLGPLSPAAKLLERRTEEIREIHLPTPQPPPAFTTDQAPMLPGRTPLKKNKR